MNKWTLYGSPLIYYCYVALILNKLFYELYLNILKHSLLIWWRIYGFVFRLYFGRYLHCQYISHLGHETVYVSPYGLAKSMGQSLPGYPGGCQQRSCLPFLSRSGAFLPDVTAPGARGLLLEKRLYFMMGTYGWQGREAFHRNGLI